MLSLSTYSPMVQNAFNNVSRGTHYAASNYLPSLVKEPLSNVISSPAHTTATLATLLTAGMLRPLASAGRAVKNLLNFNFSGAAGTTAIATAKAAVTGVVGSVVFKAHSFAPVELREF